MSCIGRGLAWVTNMRNPMEDHIILEIPTTPILVARELGINFSIAV